MKKSSPKRKRLILLTVSFSLMQLCFLSNVFAASSSYPTPKLSVDCSAPMTPGTDPIGASLTWSPLVRATYGGKSSTLTVTGGGATSIITTTRSGFYSAFLWENIRYSHTFNNRSYNLGRQVMKFVLTDSAKHSVSSTCIFTLNSSDFPSALASSSYVSPGVNFGSSKIDDSCRYRGIFLGGSVYISNTYAGSAFSVYKANSSYNADIRVLVTNYPLRCGEWKIVSSPALADFSIFLTSSSVSADFMIYTGA